MTQAPLENITNVESSLQKAKAVKENKAQGKILKVDPNPRYEFTEEMKRKAEVWAHEGVNKVHFTGKDMDALEEKMAEEEVNTRVAQALSYRSEIPCWLPGALAMAWTSSGRNWTLRMNHSMSGLKYSWILSKIGLLLMQLNFCATVNLPFHPAILFYILLITLSIAQWNFFKKTKNFHISIWGEILHNGHLDIAIENSLFTLPISYPADSEESRINLRFFAFSKEASSLWRVSSLNHRWTNY